MSKMCLLWYNYLSIVDKISKVSTLDFSTFDDEKFLCYKNLVNYYEKIIIDFKIIRFEIFINNLDILVDFKPPLLHGYSIKWYAKKMAWFCKYSEGKNFLSGKSEIIYGINGYLDIRNKL